MKKAILKLLDVSDKTFYNWRKEKRPIIKLCEKYFTKEDLEEFLETEKISKFESQITNEKNRIILDKINKKQQEIEELKTQLDIQ